jgi:DNA-binding GntR family transcriptional regulator
MPLPDEPLQSIERVPARALIAEQLRLWIVAGQLQPGENLSDVAIASRLGVSRTPVREALLQLEHEGLIESKPQGWTRVAPLDHAEMLDVHAVWTDLHVLAARLTASRIDRDLSEIERAQVVLRDLIERTEFPLRLEDPGDLDRLVAIAEADDDFHSAVVRASGNRYLARTLEPINVQMRRYQLAVVEHLTLIGPMSVDDHELLLDALRLGDVDASMTRMRANLARAIPEDLR